MSTLRTLLVDDNKTFVVLARHLLKACPQIRVIGECHDGREAVRLAATLKPDLIVMDLAMPGMGGLQATRLIKAQDAPPYILIASHYTDAAHREFAAQSGADGFLDKNDYEQPIARFAARILEDLIHA